MYKYKKKKKVKVIWDILISLIKGKIDLTNLMTFCEAETGSGDCVSISMALVAC